MFMIWSLILKKPSGTKSISTKFKSEKRPDRDAALIAHSYLKARLITHSSPIHHIIPKPVIIKLIKIIFVIDDNVLLTI
jgi:hypothetical protein